MERLRSRSRAAVSARRRASFGAPASMILAVDFTHMFESNPELMVVLRLVQLISGEEPPAVTLEDLVTPSNLQRWRAQIDSGEAKRNLTYYGLATSVRRSSDPLLSYVLLPWVHPDQEEAMLFGSSTPLESLAVRLRQVDGAWLVEQIGGFGVERQPDGTYRETPA